nr:HipA N-terminal domain-containing protein [Mycobacterium sp. AT1]
MTGLHGIDLRDIGEADVYIGDELMARLLRHSGDDIRFDYAAEKHSADRNVRDRSVSWSLLRSRDYPVTVTGGAVPSYFAGLLPEGVRLGAVTSSTKTSADDHLTVLLAIGADTTGNIRVLPAGTDPVQPGPMFDPERDDDFRSVFARLTSSVDADTVGLSGVQPKVSAGVLSTSAQTRSGPRHPEARASQPAFRCSSRTSTSS